MIFNCKDDIEMEDLKDMQPALLILFTHTVLYCKEYNLPLTITSLKTDRENVKSVSRTHEEGRAFDISVKGWTTHHIHRFIYLTNVHYSDIAAISASDHKPRAVIFHEYEDQGSHLHFQVKRSANVDRFVSYQ